MNKLLFLAVDDDEMMREVWQDLLGDLGYEVITAENGDQALQIALSRKPDIIITDVRMPGGDGIGFINKVRSTKGYQPIIYICSGYNDIKNEQLEKFQLSGIFEKPFQFEPTKKTILKTIDTLTKAKKIEKL